MQGVHEGPLSYSLNLALTCQVAHVRGRAGVLGAACTGAYHATGGSLAAAAVTHWLPVNAWLLLLGGYAKTRGSLKPAPASKERQ